MDRWKHQHDQRKNHNHSNVISYNTKHTIYQRSSVLPTSNRLIRRIHRLLSLLLNMRPLHIIRLARVAPHILLAVLRLFGLRSAALTWVADGVLHRSCVGATGARVGGAAFVDGCGVFIHGGGGLGAGCVLGVGGAAAAVV